MLAFSKWQTELLSRFLYICWFFYFIFKMRMIKKSSHCWEANCPVLGHWVFVWVAQVWFSQVPVSLCHLLGGN